MNRTKNDIILIFFPSCYTLAFRMYYVILLRYEVVIIIAYRNVYLEHNVCALWQMYTNTHAQMCGRSMHTTPTLILSACTQSCFSASSLHRYNMSSRFFQYRKNIVCTNETQYVPSPSHQPHIPLSE